MLPMILFAAGGLLLGAAVVSLVMAHIEGRRMRGWCEDVERRLNGLESRRG